MEAVLGLLGLVVVVGIFFWFRRGLYYRVRPPLAVLVLVQNREDVIEGVLRALLVHDLTVTVIDERSSDQTGAILDRFATRYPSLRVLHPAGELSPLELGLFLAEGPYVLLIRLDRGEVSTPVRDLPRLLGGMRG